LGDDLVHFHILYLICFNLVGYDLYQRAWVEKLPKVGFIGEAQYTTWLMNVVLVKKPNDKWRMCVDYVDLKKVCAKDAHPLPSIDCLVYSAMGNTILSFLNTYSNYNQIPMAQST